MWHCPYDNPSSLVVRYSLEHGPYPPCTPFNISIYNTMQYNAMQCNAMQCNTMQYNAIQCNTMQYDQYNYSYPGGHFIIQMFQMDPIGRQRGISLDHVTANFNNLCKPRASRPSLIKNTILQKFLGLHHFLCDGHR